MVDVPLVLGIVAGTAIIGTIGAIISMSSSASPLSSKTPSGIGDEGDSEFYSRGGRSKKRTRKHKKKTMRRNK